MPKKIGSAWFIYKKLQVTSTTIKLLGYKFWWNCSEFSNKMSLTIRMRIFKRKTSRCILLEFWRQIFHFSNHVRA